jgi:hypothetical protein
MFIAMACNVVAFTAVACNVVAFARDVLRRGVRS